MGRLLGFVGIAAAAATLFAPNALASQLVARNAKYPSIAVAIHNGTEVASVAYEQGGAWHRVLVWGATNAIIPRQGAHQVHFNMSYSGHTASVTWQWVKKHNACTPYTGTVPWGVTNPGGRWKCDVTKNGVVSHWALQVWQRELPDGGQPANATQRSYELQVSHWTGDLPVLWLKWDWIYPQHFDHLYGAMTYAGSPVFGFGASSTGNPTDSFGRNIYVDTHRPAWRRGYKQSGDWYRWNGFLTKRPLGNFCAGVYTHQYGRAVAGSGNKYRATAMGPGVTPIVMWEGGPPGEYQPSPNDNPTSFFTSTTQADNAFTRSAYDSGLDNRLDSEQQKMIAGAQGTKSWACEKGAKL